MNNQKNFNMENKKIKKKYLTGGKIKGYMKSPKQALAENQLNLNKAEYEAASNPFHIALDTAAPIVGQLAGGLSSNMSNNIANRGNMNIDPTGGVEINRTISEPMYSFGQEDIYDYFDPNNYMYAALGGVVGDQVEAEGQELIETPDGMVGEIKGPSHEAGGVDLNLPGGTKIYSKRLKGPDGKSMADRKKIRESTLARLRKKLEKDPTNRNLLNTIEQYEKASEAQDLQDVETMEIARQEKEQKKFASGGVVEGPGKPYSYSPLNRKKSRNMGMQKENIKKMFELTGEILDLPQKFATKLATGKFEKPSEALSRNYPNQVNTPLKKAAADIVLDPLNALSLLKVGQIGLKGERILSTTDKAIKGAIKGSSVYDNVGEVVEKYATGGITKMQGPGKPKLFTQDALDIFNTKLFDIDNPEDILLQEAVVKSNKPSLPVESLDIPNINSLSIPSVSNTQVSTRGPAVPITPKVQTDSKGLPINIGDLGTMMGLAGTGISTMAPYLNTLRNRAGDQVHENAYENYGTEGLNKFRENYGINDLMLEQAYLNNQRTTDTAMKNNRAGSRGINTSRALDLGTIQAKQQADNAASLQYFQNESQLKTQEARLIDAIDSAKIQGDLQARQLNDADRDAFYNARGVALSNMGTGIQQLGKHLGTIQNNETTNNVLGSLYKNFKFDARTGTIEGVPEQTVVNTVNNMSLKGLSADQINTIIDKTFRTKEYSIDKNGNIFNKEGQKII